MRWREAALAWLGAVLAACSNTSAAPVEAVRTTTGAIAIANLDHQIAQQRDASGLVELLLARSRFLSDYDALDRARALTEDRSDTGGELLLRARARAAVHRFADALSDVAAADRAGADRGEIAQVRASIVVATGRASEVVPQLEAAASGDPRFAAHSALAGAYAAAGRFDDADRAYTAALAALDTTSPFPYAWIYFARGLMWAESAGDPARGESMYVRALAHLPEFVTANIHLAELEIARGDLRSSTARLERVVASSNEPEALALLGELHVRAGDRERGRRTIALARQRFEALLARHPLAFADHAAAFYLGPGADPQRAWELAKQNLAGRETERAFALAIEAAWAAGRPGDACDLTARAQAAAN